MSKRKHLVRRKLSKIPRNRERQSDQTVDSLRSKTSELCPEVRYNETARLEEFLRGSQKNSDIMFVIGEPGSGKTEFCRYVLNKVFPEKELFRSEARVVQINCMISDTMQKVYTQICGALQTDGGTLVGLQNALREPKVVTTLVVLLDEIDEIRGQSRLSSFLTFLRQREEFHTRMIILGISNEQIPQCDSEQKVLEFSPYTREQVHQILKHRVSASRELKDILISPQTLKFVCVKAYKYFTDMRAVNGVLSAALTKARLRIRGSNLALEITMSDVAKAISHLGEVCCLMRKALPPIKPFEGVVLCSVYNLEKNEPKHLHTMRSAFDFYSKHTANVLGLAGCLSKSEFTTALENLRDYSLLMFENFSCSVAGDERKFSLNVTDQEICSLIENNRIFQRVIRQPKCM